MSILVTLTMLFLFYESAVSQIAYPNCTTAELDWAYNSIHQNPCEVAAYMESTCSGGSFTIDALPSGYFYGGPNGPDDSNLCECNTVTYSLVSACSACQGAGWISWSDWIVNCTNVLPPSSFPNPVPSGTLVPQWALIDVTLDDVWNPNKSMSTGDSPEVGPGSAIGASSSSTSTSSSSTGAPSPSMPGSIAPSTTAPFSGPPTASSPISFPSVETTPATAVPTITILHGTTYSVPVFFWSFSFTSTGASLASSSPTSTFSTSKGSVVHIILIESSI